MAQPEDSESAGMKNPSLVFSIQSGERKRGRVEPVRPLAWAKENNASLSTFNAKMLRFWRELGVKLRGKLHF